MFRFILIFVLIILMCSESFSQCAMCRATLENNLSNGEIGVGAGLNFGILYLLIIPYLAVMLVAYFWHKNTKPNIKK